MNRHTFEGIRITENAGNGLEVLYSDLYSSLSYIRNSEFIGNKGAGIFFKQLGLTIEGKYFAKCISMELKLHRFPLIYRQ